MSVWARLFRCRKPKLEITEMSDNRCTGCSGSGQIRLGGGYGKTVECPYCHGTGIRRR